jgi:transposase
MRTKPWELSDSFWKKVEPILLAVRPLRDPKRSYKRKPGGGRHSADLRKILAAIIRVLRTGAQWNSICIERDGVSSSTVHRKHLLWSRTGVYLQIWQAGLAEYDEFEGIAWKWQAADGTLYKAPLAQEAVGRNPTDRGKKWEQGARPVRRQWHPACVFRKCGKSKRQ